MHGETHATGTGYSFLRHSPQGYLASEESIYWPDTWKESTVFLPVYAELLNELCIGEEQEPCLFIQYLQGLNEWREIVNWARHLTFASQIKGQALRGGH